MSPTTTGGSNVLPRHLTLAPTTVPAGSPAGRDQTCRVLGCEISAGLNHNGLCVPHFDAYLTRAYELTDRIGRGDLDA